MLKSCLPLKLCKMGHEEENKATGMSKTALNVIEMVLEKQVQPVLCPLQAAVVHKCGRVWIYLFIYASTGLTWQ